MKIQKGKLYINRTWIYLYPILKHYDKRLMDFLNTFFKSVVGIADMNKAIKEPCLYILIEIDEMKSLQYKEHFINFLEWLSFQPFYETDYVYDKSHHMVVIKVPERFEASYLHFTKGRYSKMYLPKDISTLFGYIFLEDKELEVKKNLERDKVRKVLKKDGSYLPTFIQQIEKDFSVSDLKIENFKDAELDYPPIYKEEIFNYETG